MKRPRIIIIGGGFGGLACARGLKAAPADIVLIDRHNYHLFVPLLYQVATAVLSPAEIAAPLRQVLRRQANTEVMLASVTGLDTAARTLILGNGRRVPYDFLVIATGSTHSYFGHPEWAPHAPPVKSIEDATEIRRRLLLAFEQAENADDPDERKRLMTIVIVGGGSTGVEIAGAVAELVRRGMRRDFRRIDPTTQATIVLVEAGPRLLTGFPEKLGDYAGRTLGRLGVELRLHTRVESITTDGVQLASGLLPAATVIWGAGVRATPIAEWFGAATDKTGRIEVAPDLTVRGHTDIYAIGDVASCAGADGKPLPALAQVAEQQGEYLAQALVKRMRSETGKPFRFRNSGNLATVGRNAAVGDFGRWQITGATAWLIWGVVHIYLLIGFGNRLLVALNWLLVYVTDRRNARLIIDDAERSG